VTKAQKSRNSERLAKVRGARMIAHGDLMFALDQAEKASQDLRSACLPCQWALADILGRLTERVERQSSYHLGQDLLKLGSAYALVALRAVEHALASTRLDSARGRARLVLGDKKAEGIVTQWYAKKALLLLGGPKEES